MPHVVPSTTLLCLHLPASSGSQRSVVHGLPSSQFGPPVPLHTPAWQKSVVVHGLPSLHTFVSLFTCAQPVLASQESLVHALLSSQLTAVPVQLPPEHVSLVVHTEPSSHASLLFTPMQPCSASHLASTQMLPLAAHTTGLPAMHTPFKHASPLVHALSSLQLAVLSVCEQPAVGVQVSSVQGLLSLQEIGPATAVHAPVLQVEPLL